MRIVEDNNQSKWHGWVANQLAQWNVYQSNNKRTTTGLLASCRGEKKEIGGDTKINTLHLITYVHFCVCIVVCLFYDHKDWEYNSLEQACILCRTSSCPNFCDLLWNDKTCLDLWVDSQSKSYPSPCQDQPTTSVFHWSKDLGVFVLFENWFDFWSSWSQSPMFWVFWIFALLSMNSNCKLW